MRDTELARTDEFWNAIWIDVNESRAYWCSRCVNHSLVYLCDIGPRVRREEDVERILKRIWERGDFARGMVWSAKVLPFAANTFINA